MTKLTDLQLVLLADAAKRDDRAVEVPARLKGGAAGKVLDPLLKRRLIKAVPWKPSLPVWRTAEDGTKTALIVTDAGLRAIHVEPDQPEPAEPTAKQAKGKRASRGAGKDKRGRETPSRKAAAKAPRKSRSGTKQAQLIEMLSRKDGATIDEIVKAFGWQPHTVRGAIAGALKKKLGLEVTSEKIETRGRVYRIAA
jgi:hypothetical protein